MTSAIVGVVVGVIAGIASGLAGVGGGVVMVPAMTELMGLAQSVAQGTSLVAILFTSVSGTIVNVRNRRADLRSAAVIGIAGVFSVRLGSSLALSLDQVVLRRLFGILVLVSGVRMMVRLARSDRQPNPA